MDLPLGPHGHRSCPSRGGPGLRIRRAARRHPAQPRRRAHRDPAGHRLRPRPQGSDPRVHLRLRSRRGSRRPHRRPGHRRLRGAALVADGLHARTDGFASLAVLVAAGGGWLGWDWADPIIGLAITAAILLVLKDAAKEVFARLLDAVDPAMVDAAETSLRAIPGVQDVRAVRLRWIGHRLHAEAEIVADADLSLRAAHEIAADAEHQLTHAIPHLAGAIVHVDPASHPGVEHHADLSHARRQH